MKSEIQRHKEKDKRRKVYRDTHEITEKRKAYLYGPRKPMREKIERVKARESKGNPHAQFRAAQGELEAAIFFSRRGYYVYRNLAQAGPDLVVIKNGKCRVVEVQSHNKAENDVLRAPRHICDFVFYVRGVSYILLVVETNEKKIFPREVI